MFKVGIIGAGWIAQKMAKTLAPLQDYCVHAIASRSLEKVEQREACPGREILHCKCC